jgi:hypothetical protein
LRSNTEDMKKLFTLIAVVLGTSAMAQNLPTLHSYTVDTLCDGAWDTYFISITLEDLDGDSTYIDVVTPNNAVMDSQGPFTVINPPYTGSTLRTIEVYGTASAGLPSGVNLADVNFEFYGHPINDPQGGASDVDITDIPVYGVVSATWNPSNLTFCSNENPVDLTQWVVEPGGEFYMAN